MSELLEITRDIWEPLYREGHRLSYPNDVFVRVTHGLLDNHIHPRVLDYGCGSGENLLHLAQRGFRVTGGDICPSALDTTRERFAEAGLEADLRLIQGRSLPFADAAFDAVVAWQVLTYNDWETLPGVLSELDRVLRPGGRFLATMSAPGDYMEKNGRPLGNGLYQLQDRGQEGAIIMIVEEQQIPACFPGTQVDTGWFGHEFMGVPSRHWIVSYEKK